MRRLLMMCAMLALSTATANAQKIIVDEVDIFTKEQIIQTSDSYIYTSTNESPAMRYEILKEGEKVMLNVFIKGIKNFEDGPNISAQILTLDVNEEIKSIDSNRDLNLRGKTATSNIHWGFGISSGKLKETNDVTIKFPISVEDAIYFREIPITNLRIKIGGNKFDYSLGTSLQKEFSKTFEIIIPYRQKESEID